MSVPDLSGLYCYGLNKTTTLLSRLCHQSAIELVIPPLPCRASLANESSTRLENERIRFGHLAHPANVTESRLIKPGQQPQVAEEH